MIPRMAPPGAEAIAAIVSSTFTAANQALIVAWQMWGTFLTCQASKLVSYGTLETCPTC